MHRDHDGGPQPLDDPHHAGQVHRRAPIHRCHHHIQTPKRRILFSIRLVVQMPQMANAQPRHLEHKDRISIVLDPRPLRPDVRRDVAHQHLAKVQTVVDALAKLSPTGQHMRNFRVGIGRPMGVMGVVHRDHIGDHRRTPGKAGEVRDHVQPARRTDQKTGMRDIVDAHRFSRNINVIAGLLDVFGTVDTFGQRNAMAGRAGRLLGDCDAANKDKDQGEPF
mmetsp:Transcript_28715/g.54307  ORF Transcript_28715/g.54307 Transcript_28715/m.54307 type:complete len:221 (-) Transcript_28715:3457-4119(-)